MGSREFSLSIQSKSGGSETLSVKLSGEATLQSTPTAELAVREPVIRLPGQLLALSTETVDMGDLVVFGVVRRVVAVRNIADNPVSFRWLCGDLGSVLQIIPASGALLAGESRLCQVILRGLDGARIYDLDIALESVDEAAQDDFENATLAASKDRDLASAGFTLTDQGRTGRGRAGAFDTAKAPGSLSSARTVLLSSTEFPSKLLAPGFNPTLTTSMSPALQGDPAITSTGALSASCSLGSSVRKGKQQLSVSDLDLRTSKYTVWV
jgi:hypothetical protein